MRWELLFGDLETQWHASTQQDFERHVNELARIEASQVTLAEALRGASGEQLSVFLCTGTAYHGEVLRVEKDWALLREENRSVIVPLTKVVRVNGLGLERQQSPSQVGYSLAAALRVLARNRSAVVLELDTAAQAGSSAVHVRGVLDQVGADYVQLMQLADGVGRDPGNRQGSVVIPLGRLVSIASSPDNEF
ncbi:MULTISPECIES: hypothetical protein [Arthrobacter]|uniref:hypothetical protein n=1 Tax=Arthrobacter TaxID=1663 RepID=UPI0033917EBD